MIWLDPLSNTQKLGALAILYSGLTVGTRQVFLPDVASGKERQNINMLHGINELHHTVANQVIAYSSGKQGCPPDVFAGQLIQIADRYGLSGLLAQTVDFVRSRDSIKQIINEVTIEGQTR